ncbi:MAG TPA: AraC family transcriptional regulator [Armatimonadota bacterium]|jgi:AraC-like DNA-binding protein
MRRVEGQKENFVLPEDFPVWLRRSQVKRPTPYGPNYHAAMEIHLIRSGNGQYFIRDANYLLGTNTVIIVHKNEIHTYIPDPEPAVIKDTYLLFSPHLLRQRPVASAALRRLAHIRHLVLSNSQVIVAEFLLNNIAEEAANEYMNWKESILNHIENFLIILHRAAEGEVVNHVNPDPVMPEIIRYLEEKFTENLSLAELSNHFGLSSYNLCRRFKKYVGSGFKEYVILRRIVEAKKLLEETDMKVTAVAYEVGFDSTSTFNRDFRLLTGVTPADYRRLAISCKQAESLSIR